MTKYNTIGYEIIICPLTSLLKLWHLWTLLSQIKPFLAMLVQIWYLSSLLHQKILYNLETYPQKTPNSQHFFYPQYWIFSISFHRIGMIFQFLYVHAHFIFYHWVRHNLILQKNESYYLNCTSNTSTRWHFTRVVIICCLWCLWWWWWSSLALGCQAGQRGRCEACCWNAGPCSWHKIKVVIIILIIIITFLIVIFTRPWPAFGRQGLDGSPGLYSFDW